DTLGRTGCMDTWPEKLRPLGDRTAVGEAAASGYLPVAVPERITAWGLPVGLSVIFKMPVRVPAAEGLKVTWTEHLAPAASAMPQLFFWAKSFALTPVRVMEVMSRAVLPELVRERIFGPAVAPTA